MYCTFHIFVIVFYVYIYGQRTTNAATISNTTTTTTITTTTPTTTASIATYTTSFTDILNVVVVFRALQELSLRQWRDLHS